MPARLAEKTSTRLLFLDLSDGRVSVNPDGSDLKTILAAHKQEPAAT